MYDDACAYALKLAEEKGYTFVHPFDDLDVACGQGSIAMEIVQELPTVDYILVPIGGGGLVTGISTLAKMLNPEDQSHRRRAKISGKYDRSFKGRGTCNLGIC